MFIKNCWYVAGWSHELTPDGVLSRRICDLPVVMWRDSTGRPVALHDQCCHRGAALSKGRRESDCIRCMYHGLKFNADGVCVEAPGQSNIPPQARVRKLPIVERHRWLWIWMGEPADADEALLPDTHWLDEPGWACTTPGYLHYDVDYQLINDNLLDFSHIAFVHQGTLGGSEEYARLRPRIDRIDRGLRITRWQFDIEPAPFIAKVASFPGHVDRWNIYDFLLPGVLIMDSGFAAAGSGAAEGRRDGAIEFRACQAVTPESASSSHYFFALPHNFAQDDEAVNESLHQSILQAFEEDREIITAQAESTRANSDFTPVLFAMDAGLAQFRRLVMSAIEREARSSQQPTD